MSKNLFLVMFFLAFIVGIVALGLNSPKGKISVKNVINQFGLNRGQADKETYLKNIQIMRKKAAEQKELAEHQQDAIMESRRTAQQKAEEDQISQRERMEDMKARQDAQREMLMDRLRDQQR